jgi:DNA-binding IclR family transcriptional regulator
LGARGTPERRLRVAARRPLAELAAVTGAAVALTAAIGDDAVFLAIDARDPLGFDPDLGSPIPTGTAQARAHAGIRHLTPIVDAGDLIPVLSCVAVPIALRSGEVAVVSTLVNGMRPPVTLMAATRNTAARIGGLLREPSQKPMLIEKSSFSERLVAQWPVTP